MKVEAKRRLESCADGFGSRAGQNSASMHDQIRPVVNFMMFKDRPEKLREFRERTLHLDEMRDRNTIDAIPELAPLLHESASRKRARTAKQAVGMFLYKLRGQTI